MPYEQLVRVFNKINISNDTSADIYHYTSPTGFKGIIEEAKLRFSDNYYLNDKGEGSYVLDLLLNNLDRVYPDAFIKDEVRMRCLEYMKQRKDMSFRAYLCSFSQEPDSLSLWNYYTKGDTIKGYNLKFNAKNLLSSLGPISLETGSTVKPIGRKVIYEKEKQLSVIIKIFESFNKFFPSSDEHFKRLAVSLMLEKIMLCGMFFKSPYFETEKEYRIIINIPLDNDFLSENIKLEERFAEKNGFFIPYISVPFCPSALEEVKMSPTLDFELTRASVKRILRSKFSHIEYPNITQSDITVRY